MTTQAEIKVSSKPETPPQDTNLQSSLTEITPRPDSLSSTFPLKSRPATDMQDGGTVSVVKTLTEADTQTTGSTNRGKAKPNTLSKEAVQRSSKKLTQAHLPASATKEGSTRNNTTLLENVLKSNIQPENPTAPPAVQDAESAKRVFSNVSHVSEFATSSTVTSGSTTESGFVASSLYHTSKEEKQEASLLLVTHAVSASPLLTASVKVFTTREGNVSLKSTAPQTNPTPTLTVITPTLQSTGETLNNRAVAAEMRNISAGGLKEKEEIDDRLETVSTKTDTTPQQHAGEKKESRRETDVYEIYLRVDEEVDTEMGKGSNDDDTEKFNQTLLDRLSQLGTVLSETPGDKLRPGIRGQRVRHC